MISVYEFADIMCPDMDRRKAVVNYILENKSIERIKTISNLIETKRFEEEWKIDIIDTDMDIIENLYELFVLVNVLNERIEFNDINSISVELRTICSPSNISNELLQYTILVNKLIRPSINTFTSVKSEDRSISMLIAGHRIYVRMPCIFDSIMD